MSRGRRRDASCTDSDYEVELASERRRACSPSPSQDAHGRSAKKPRPGRSSPDGTSEEDERRRRRLLANRRSAQRSRVKRLEEVGVLENLVDDLSKEVDELRSELSTWTTRHKELLDEHQQLTARLQAEDGLLDGALPDVDTLNLPPGPNWEQQQQQQQQQSRPMHQPQVMQGVAEPSPLSSAPGPGPVSQPLQQQQQQQQQQYAPHVKLEQDCSSPPGPSGGHDGTLQPDSAATADIAASGGRAQTHSASDRAGSCGGAAGPHAAGSCSAQVPRLEPEIEAGSGTSSGSPLLGRPAPSDAPYTPGSTTHMAIDSASPLGGGGSTMPYRQGMPAAAAAASAGPQPMSSGFISVLTAQQPQHSHADPGVHGQPQRYHHAPHGQGGSRPGGGASGAPPSSLSSVAPGPPGASGATRDSLPYSQLSAGGAADGSGQRTSDDASLTFLPPMPSASPRGAVSYNPTSPHFRADCPSPSFPRHSDASGGAGIHPAGSPDEAYLVSATLHGWQEEGFDTASPSGMPSGPAAHGGGGHAAASATKYLRFPPGVVRNRASSGGGGLSASAHQGLPPGVSGMSRDAHLHHPHTAAMAGGSVMRPRMAGLLHPHHTLVSTAASPASAGVGPRGVGAPGAMTAAPAPADAPCYRHHTPAAIGTPAPGEVLVTVTGGGGADPALASQDSLQGRSDGTTTAGLLERTAGAIHGDCGSAGGAGTVPATAASTVGVPPRHDDEAVYPDGSPLAGGQLLAGSPGGADKVAASPDSASNSSSNQRQTISSDSGRSLTYTQQQQQQQPALLRPLKPQVAMAMAPQLQQQQQAHHHQHQQLQQQAHQQVAQQVPQQMGMLGRSPPPVATQQAVMQDLMGSAVPMEGSPYGYLTEQGGMADYHEAEGGLLLDAWDLM